MNLGDDPAYLAALEAAFRSSVLAAPSSAGIASLARSPLSSTSTPPPPASRVASHGAPAGPVQAQQPFSSNPTAPRQASEPSSSRATAEGGSPLASSPPANGGGAGLAQRAALGRSSDGGGQASAAGRGSNGDGGEVGRGRESREDRKQRSSGAEKPPLPLPQQQPTGGSRAVDSAAAVAASAAKSKPAGAREKAAAPAAAAAAAGRAPEAAGKKERGTKKDSSWFGSYYEHWSQADLSTGLKSGQLFRGKIRINPGNTAEAYVTVPGLPHDLLVRGELSRNRAVEGDEVAVQVQPPAAWFVRNKVAQQQQSNGDSDTADKRRGPEECPWRDCTSPDQVKEVMAGLLTKRPELRATGKVVGILTPSAKREHLVGLLRLAGQLPDVGLPAWDPSQGAMPRPLSVAVEAALAADAGDPPPSDGRPHFQLLPSDPRLPACRVPTSQVYNMSAALLAGLLRGEPEAGRTLVSARIRSWPTDSTVPVASLRASLGQAGEIESETAAILEAEAIRSEDFDKEVLACLPALPWRVREEDLVGRRDFRSHRVFSIDPPTAKDLDDALSIEPLPGGEGWRVGVHIADVSHFIAPFSALDVEAGRRATSTYLVQRVIPMLPPLLCEQLCSLNPGEERLTFSCVWDMGNDGSIRSTWFGRSVIRSCAKLSYPLVQRMIEGDFRPEDTGVPLHGEGITWAQVEGDSLTLWSIAKQLREARYRGGALRLDNMRLFFSLDKDGNPVGAAPYVQKEANQLVEEFMVLANISVAQFISRVFPNMAMLRRHPPPNGTKMQELREAAESVGVPLDISSAASLQTCLAALRASQPPGAAAGSAEGGDPDGNDGAAGGLLSAAARHRRKVELLVMLATRPMQLAQYFSTGTCENAHDLWRHYALAVGHYTHFTSPIRRYPDVVVHRQLAAALDVTEGGLTPEQAASKHQLLNPELTARVADHCNDRRLAARDAQDASLRLYLCVLLRRQPVVALATVNSLGGDLYFSAYLTEFGVEVQLKVEDAGVPLAAEWNQGAKVLTLTHGSADGAAAAGGGGALGRKRQGAGGRGGARRSSSGGGGGDSGGPKPSLAEWVESLAPVRNPHGLQPAALPLHLRQFDEVPVVLTAVMVAGAPPQLAARIYFPEAEAAMEALNNKAAAAAAAKPAVEAAGEGEGVGPAVQQSMVPWDSMLQD